MEFDTLISRNLVYFSALYRERNYNLAAKSIPISYQGLKKAIQRLEADLEIELFEQANDGVLKPTPYADMLYESARKCLFEARDLRTRIERAKDHGREVYSIAVSVGMAMLCGEREDGDEASANSPIRIDAIEYPDCFIDEMLEDGFFSCGIVSSPFNPSFDVIPLLRMPDCVWVPARSPLANKGVIELHDLDGMEVMLPNRHFKTYCHYKEAIEAKKFLPSRIRLCSSALDSMMFAAQGKGVGIGTLFIDELLKDCVDSVCKPINDGFDHLFAFATLKTHKMTCEEKKALSIIKHKIRKSTKRFTTTAIELF